MWVSRAAHAVRLEKARHGEDQGDENNYRNIGRNARLLLRLRKTASN